MPNQKTTYVVIPCFNEAEVIRKTVQEVSQAGYKIIIVDDCSTDETQKILQGLPVVYIRHKFNLGQGAALQTGMDMAVKLKADRVISFDADGQHDVNDLIGIDKKADEEGLDLVLGSRFMPGSRTNIRAGRKLFLKSARFMNYIFTGVMLTDAHNGFRVFNKKALERIRIRENRMAHASELLRQIRKLKLTFAEFPVHIRYTAYSRKKGQSLLNSVRIVFELLLNKIFDK